MGDVVQLPVRREQPQEHTDRPQRQAPAPLETEPSESRHGESPRETRPGVEPLWRESVGRELRRERLAAGKRLVDVSEEAGVSPQYLSEVERGLKDPSSELLAAMAGALGLSVAEIATRVGTSSPSTQSPVYLAA
ncbi:MAG: helix-turn-helix transcriptional regulator [Nocardioides sp.]|nr:helix-turn-helix transcriptional regulator [Nocardioides sp.]